MLISLPVTACRKKIKCNLSCQYWFQQTNLSKLRAWERETKTFLFCPEIWWLGMQNAVRSRRGGQRVNREKGQCCFSFSPLLSSLFLQIPRPASHVLFWLIFTGHGGDKELVGVQWRDPRKTPWPECTPRSLLRFALPWRMDPPLASWLLPKYVPLRASCA